MRGTIPSVLSNTYRSSLLFVHPHIFLSFHFMCLCVDFSGSIIHTSVKCTIHKCEGSFISFHRIFAADSLPSITCSAKSRNKLFFYLHFILLNFPYVSLSFRETKIQATIYSLLFTNIFIYSSVFCCILQQTDL